MSEKHAFFSDSPEEYDRPIRIMQSTSFAEEPDRRAGRFQWVADAVPEYTIRDRMAMRETPSSDPGVDVETEDGRTVHIVVPSHLQFVPDVRVEFSGGASSDEVRTRIVCAADAHGGRHAIADFLEWVGGTPDKTRICMTLLVAYRLLKE